MKTSRIALSLAVMAAGASSLAAAAVAEAAVKPTVCGPGTCENTTARSINYWPRTAYESDLVVTASGHLSGHDLSAPLTSPKRIKMIAVGLAPTGNGRGYWIARRSGAVTGVGTAKSTGPIKDLQSTVTGITANTKGKGFWLVSEKGRVYARDGAKSLGSLVWRSSSSPVVGIASTPNGKGYYVVERNGTVTPFGDAKVSMPKHKVSTPVVAIAVNPAGRGYWLVSRSGVVTPVGGAQGFGSAHKPASAVVGIAATRNGNGYILAEKTGAVLSFGDARSLIEPREGAVAVATDPVADSVRLKPSARTGLRVDLTDLPPDTLGDVTVHGPGGFSARLDRSETLHDLTPGTYTVTANGARWKQYSVESEWKTTSATLHAGASPTLRIPYNDVINPKARSITPDAILSVTRSAGQYVVRASDPSHGLATGDVLAVAPGKADPQGLLLKIGTLTRSDGVDRFDAANASLTDLAPAGAINLSHVALSVPRQRGTVSGKTAHTDSAHDLLSNSQIQYDEGVQCSGGHTVSVTGGVNFEPTFQFAASWGGLWHPLTLDAAFAVGSSQSFSYSATVTGNMTCQYSKDLLKDGIKLGTISFSIDGFPVIINPTLNFEFDAQGTINGSATVDVSENSTEQVGLEYDGHLTPIHSFSGSFSLLPQSASASAQLQVGIAPQLNFGFYDTDTGPYIGAEGYLEYDMGTSNPWWQLLLGLQPYAGLQVGIDDHDWSWTYNWTPWTTVLAQATTPLPPSVATTQLPSGTVGSSYSTTLTAKGGATPIYWEATGLPAGLSLNPVTGVISGKPTSEGSYTVTVTPVDHDGQTGTAVSLPISVAYAPLTAQSTALAAGIVDSPYTGQLDPTGGSGTYRWSVTSGSLPAGLQLNGATGAITGTPTAADVGSTTLTFQVQDLTSTGAVDQTATVQLTLSVADGPLDITTAGLPEGVLESSYDQTLAASGGAPPYTWSVSSGSLPEGLSLDPSTGEITGTPIVSGTSMSFGVTATDSLGGSTSATLSMSVIAPGDLLPTGVGTFEHPTEPTSAWYEAFSPDAACLTAGTTANQEAASGGAGSIAPCNFTVPDTDGSGALELTNNGSGDNDAPTGRVGATFYNGAIPTSAGLDITFDSYQFDSDLGLDGWTGPGGVEDSGADGITFSLAAINPATSALPGSMETGGAGADLGYASNGTTDGLSDGYLGIGFDAFGNFANAANFAGAGCSTPTGLESGEMYPESVTVHGPGNEDDGYCILASSAQQVNAGSGFPDGGGWDQNLSDVNNPGGGALDSMDTTSRSGSIAVPAEVIINTTASAAVSSDDPSFTVPAGDWGVIYQPIGGSWTLLDGALPTNYPGTYPTSWINPNTNLPYEMTFGWTASFGANNEVHQVGNVAVAPVTAAS